MLQTAKRLGLFDRIATRLLQFRFVVYPFDARANVGAPNSRNSSFSKTVLEISLVLHSYLPVVPLQRTQATSDNESSFNRNFVFY